MTSDQKEPNCQQEPPGNRFKKLAKRSRMCAAVMSHTHVLQIIDDHQAMWFATSDAAERQRIEIRLRRQLRYAMVNFVGFETTVHGVITLAMMDPLQGGVLIVLGIALMRATGKG